MYDLVQRVRLRSMGINPDLLTTAVGGFKMPLSDYAQKRGLAELKQQLEDQSKLYKTTEGFLSGKDAKGKMPFSSKGISARYTPEGGFELTMGGNPATGGVPGLERSTAAKMEQKLLAINDSIAGLQDIAPIVSNRIVIRSVECPMRAPASDASMPA